MTTYESPRARPARFELGAAETLDFWVDWFTNWLDGDTISGAVWTVEDGLTNESDEVTGGKTGITLSWDTGEIPDPVGRTRSATVTVTTAAGRVVTANIEIVGVEYSGIAAFDT